MQFDYVYADLQCSLTLKADDDSAFGNLTNDELMALQPILYLALSTFNNSRNLYYLGLIDKDKIRGSENAQDDDEPDGG